MHVSLHVVNDCRIPTESATVSTCRQYGQRGKALAGINLCVPQLAHFVAQLDMQAHVCVCLCPPFLLHPSLARHVRRLRDHLRI